MAASDGSRLLLDVVVMRDATAILISHAPKRPPPPPDEPLVRDRINVAAAGMKKIIRIPHLLLASPGNRLPSNIKSRRKRRSSDLF